MTNDFTAMGILWDKSLYRDKHYIYNALNLNKIYHIFITAMRSQFTIISSSKFLKVFVLGSN